MASNRIGRINEEIQRELSEQLRRLKDPRVSQTGMVSGIFGGGAENYYASFRDLLKCYIAANTHFENWPLLINKELFESLSAEDQKILLEKSAAFEARRWEVAEAEQQNAFAEMGRKASWPELKKAIGDKAYEEVISTFVLE